MLKRIVEERWFNPKAVIGFWPANAVGDDIRLYTGESRQEKLATFHGLRQQLSKRDGKPNMCLSDFVAPKAERHRRLCRCFRGDGRLEEERISSASPAPMTIIPRSWSRRWPTVRRSLRRAHA
jgi:5-methyltetrahydrofolate--homocysteine methyltransferase